MEGGTPSLRDQGTQALKEGNLDKAIDFLARAAMADDNDSEAKALLGIAYSQKGLHAQAKRALQTAVEREPRNENHRFNLGIVCERAGDTQGAAIAFRDTLEINPQHAQARAKLNAIPNSQQILANAPKPTGPVGVPGTEAPGGYAAPQPSYQPPAAPAQPYQPPAAPAQPPSYAPPQASTPPQQPGYAPPPTQPTYAPTQPPAYTPPGPGPYGAAPPQSYSAPTTPYTAPGAAYQQPHRGVLILILGIVALLVCPLTGIASWIMANQDIPLMDQGVMDPSGKGMTNAGRIIGIVGLLLNCVCGGAYVLIMLMGAMSGGGG